MSLPDDWGLYYRKCRDCGGFYHLSGSEVCFCRPEDEETEDETDDI